MDERSINAELNDFTIRLILIPFFGFVIPNVTGMIDNGRYVWWELIAAYLFFTFISFSVWHGNRYLLFRIRPRFSWLSQPVYKIIALVVSNIFYTIPVSVGLSVLWYAFTGHSDTDWNAVFKVTALCVVCVVFITHTYETVFLIRSWGSDKLRGEQLERARIQAELEALKTQIDPHFIFNSLNTLSHLTEVDPAKAKEFTGNLADVYRYILMNKGRDLVFLKEELDFLQSYFELAKIRFGSAIRLNVRFNGELLESYVMPPISLQVLMENAVKHNEFSENDPLVVECTFEGDSIHISNSVRKKISQKPTSGIGLKNLGERYKLATNKEITIRQSVDIFEVWLPVLKTRA